MTSQVELHKELVQALRSMIEHQKKTLSVLEDTFKMELTDDRSRVNLLEKNLKMLEDKLGTLEKK